MGSGPPPGPSVTMRRRLPLLLAALLVVAVGVLPLVGASPVAAEDTPSEFPSGFTDGEPVGSPEEPPPSVGESSEGTIGAAATQERYFGREAFDAVRTAVANTPRACVVSNDGLTGLVMAPIFKESSAATTASSAPAPMTLSRYDEWNGVYSTDTNQSANYGLYAFRDPYTSYHRAYWHPGIGIWQYDSAGVGAPFTAVERMHVGIVAGDVAKGMAHRYCQAAGQTEQERRYEAWRPWGYPCTLCEGFFQEMMTASPRFSNLQMVDGITALGGTVERSCALSGVEGTMPCWYVDPAVGVIEGYTGWATYEPDGKNDPTVKPAPVSKPFYVLDRGTTEERHWLRADTGYSIDISAVRQLGKNARPRTNQPGSGLDWRSTSGLCDLTTGRGACGPAPSDGLSTTSFTVTGTYQPVALDADGDGLGDIFWYRPGTASDVLWHSTGIATFTSKGFVVNGSYDHVLAGDVDGLHGDEMLWYSSTSGAAHLWISKGDGTFTYRPFSVGPGRVPFLLDSDGDDRMEVFWYGPGSVPDAHWTWNGTWFDVVGHVLTRSYRPLAGDFDGNGRDDIFWYGPGTRPDSIWYFAQAGGFTSIVHSIDADAQPVVGDLDGLGRSDIVWYQPGSGADSVWFGLPGGAFDRRSISVSLPYTPVVVDLDGNPGDELVWDAHGTGADYRWSWRTDRTFTTEKVKLPGTTVPIVGPFSRDGGAGVLWYVPGLAPDVLWYR